MHDQSTQEEPRSARPVLQMPSQAPPIDRTSTMPAGAGNETSGVEANFVPFLGGMLRLLI